MESSGTNIARQLEVWVAFLFLVIAIGGAFLHFWQFSAFLLALIFIGAVLWVVSCEFSFFLSDMLQNHRKQVTPPPHVPRQYEPGKLVRDEAGNIKRIV